MKHTLPVLASAALIAITGCSASNIENASESIQSSTIEAANSASTELLPSSDGYDMRVMYQWIPELPTIRPAEARLNIEVEGETQETEDSYVTPTNLPEQVPSIDSGQYLTKDFHVSSGGMLTAQSSVSDPSNGRLTCLIVETEQEVVLDYQETSVGSDETLTCMGFTQGDHEYEAGKPPVEVKFD